MRCKCTHLNAQSSPIFTSINLSNWFRSEKERKWVNIKGQVLSRTERKRFLPWERGPSEILRPHLKRGNTLGSDHNSWDIFLEKDETQRVSISRTIFVNHQVRIRVWVREAAKDVSLGRLVWPNEDTYAEQNRTTGGIEDIKMSLSLPSSPSQLSKVLCVGGLGINSPEKCLRGFVSCVCRPSFLRAEPNSGFRLSHPWRDSHGTQVRNRCKSYEPSFVVKR